MMTCPQNSFYLKERHSDHSLSSKTNRGWDDHHGYTRYSPSVLVISDRSTQLCQLKQWLQHKSRQVRGITITSNELASISHHYFDLIVVDLEPGELAGPQNQGVLLSALQKLKTYPELNNLPLIILTNGDEVRRLVTQSATGPVYCLGKGSSTEAALLQLIDQIHYLSYRYL